LKLRRKMGHNGRRVVGRYDWGRIHDVIDRQITRLAGGRI